MWQPSAAASWPAVRDYRRRPNNCLCRKCRPYRSAGSRGERAWSGMITARVAPFRLPRGHPRLRRAAAVADDRPREGGRDTGPAPSNQRPATATRGSTPTATTRGPGIPRYTSRAAVPRDAAQTSSAGQPGHRPAVAPRPDDTSPHTREPAPQGWACDCRNCCRLRWSPLRNRDRDTRHHDHPSWSVWPISPSSICSPPSASCP